MEKKLNKQQVCYKGIIYDIVIVRTDKMSYTEALEFRAYRRGRRFKTEIVVHEARFDLDGTFGIVKYEVDRHGAKVQGPILIMVKVPPASQIAIAY